MPATRTVVFARRRATCRFRCRRMADWHAETFHQPFSRPATSAVAEKMNKFSDSLGPPSVRTNNFRQLIRKCLTLALPVQTSPTAHLHLHHHGGALHGEILKMTEVSAVPTCRRRAASGTGPHFRSCGRDHPTITVPLDPKNPHTRRGSPIHVLSHARLSARRPIKPTSTESEADPHDLRHIAGFQKGGSGSSAVEIMRHAVDAANDDLRWSGV